MFKLFNPLWIIKNFLTTYIGGGGGGGSSTGTSYTTNVPPGMEDYAKRYSDIAQQQVFKMDADGNIIGFNPYVPYSANPQDYVAGFSPMQQQAFQGAANLQVSPMFDQGAELARLAGLGGLDSVQRAYRYGDQGYQSGQLGQKLGVEGGGYYGNLGQQIGQMGLQAQQTGQDITGMSKEIAARQAGAGADYAAMATNPYVQQQYMSPYIQNVMDLQKQGVMRDYEIQNQMRQANAAKSGAYGGSRQAIEQAEANRALNAQLQNIEAQGLQAAYDKAIQSMQYGAGLNLQGLGGAQSGLGTALQGGQLGLSGIGTALQGVQTGLQGVGTQMQGTGQGMQGAQTGLQGVAGGQAGYGLANTAANTLGNLGTLQGSQAMEILGLQNQFGTQQQQQQQSIIDQAINNYAQAQMYPYQQLQYLSNLLRGATGQAVTTQNYAAPTNIGGQLLGAGTAAYGLSQMGRGRAEGGPVKSYAEGGITSLDNVQRIASKLSIPQLDKSIKNGTIPRDMGQDMIDMKSAQEARMRAAQVAQQMQAMQRPEAQGIDELSSNLPIANMAGGGIVAFGEGGDIPSYAGPDGSLVSQNPSLNIVPEGVDPVQWGRMSDYERSHYLLNRRKNVADAVAVATDPLKSMLPGRSAYLKQQASDTPIQKPTLIDDRSVAPAANAKPGTNITYQRIDDPTKPITVGAPSTKNLMDQVNAGFAPIYQNIEKLASYKSPYEEKESQVADKILTRLNETPITREQAETEAAKMYPNKAYEEYEKYVKKQGENLDQREKDLTPKGFIKAGLRMMIASQPKPGQPTPTIFNVFAEGANEGIEYTDAQLEKIDRAKDQHQKALADIEQARRLEEQGKYKESQRLYERGQDRNEKATDSAFNVYSSLNKRDQDRMANIVHLNAQARVAQFKEMSDIGQTGIREQGAAGRLEAELNYGKKGSAAEKGGWTNKQIADMRDAVMDQARANIEASPQWQSKGKSQRKNPQVMQAYNKALAEEIDRLVEAQIEGVNRSRYGNTPVINYNSLVPPK